jgi:hypothetical protein
MKRIALILILIVLLALIETKGFKWLPKQQREELLYFPSNRFVKAVTAGSDLILADFLWIETGSYFGKHRRSDKLYPYLYHMLDIITDLDPKFIPPYTLGTILLATDARESDLALKFLDKGMRDNPELWQIPFTKGFIYYIHNKNLKEASKWFLLASYKKDAPEMVQKFATWTLYRSKGVELTLRLYLRLYEVSSSEIFIEKAIKGMAMILSDQYKQFYMDKGFYAGSLFDLYKYGYLPFIPQIPGGRFKIENGKVIFQQLQ